MKNLLAEVQKLQKIAGILKESQLNEETFLSKMEKLNPGYSKDSILADFADEYELDNPEDKEDHDEYMKDAELWFDKMASTGPTVKVGDAVKVFAKSIGKEVYGKIAKETVMKGSHGFAGDIKPDNIPSWSIDCYKDPNMTQKIGTLIYPQFEEGEGFYKM
jgi:hypothetical protein